MIKQLAITIWTMIQHVVLYIKSHNHTEDVVPLVTWMYHDVPVYDVKGNEICKSKEHMNVKHIIRHEREVNGKVRYSYEFHYSNGGICFDMETEPGFDFDGKAYSDKPVDESNYQTIKITAEKKPEPTPPLFEELYDKYVQVNDRFETVHVWNRELAFHNNGKYVPREITKETYYEEMKHSWNN